MDWEVRYRELQKCVEELENENRELRHRLGLAEPTTHEQADQQSVCEISVTAPVPAVHMRSTPEEKIRLFRSLFRGREDVYARRWYSVQKEKSGYAPVCANEWRYGVCIKPKGKCSKCENRELVPLDDAAIYKHLSGKDPNGGDVIGLYPILSDDTCCFLAIDFDDGTWRENVAAVRSVCTDWNIPCGVERSRSGEGAHLWIFFEEPIPCVTARKLGSALLTEAMEQEGKLKLDSYDRMFPNQDTLPNGGFGNLIALPLQGQARKKGNSEFVDEAFRPYQDQWAYLSEIQRLNTEIVEALIKTHSRGDALGDLCVTEPTSKPWEKKRQPSMTAMDFRGVQKIVRSNMLYIPADGFSSRVRNQIIRLAAFRNPDFYKSQAMRLPIYDKPRIICTAEERDGYLALPRCCEDSLIELLENTNAAYELEDKTFAGRPIDVSFNGILRAEQIPAAEALLERYNGVLSATTAFGKTVIAAYLIGQRKVNTLVLVHTQALLNQWKASLSEFLEINEVLPELPKKRGRKKERSLIGQLGGTKNTLSGFVDIAIIQSLISGEEVRELVKDYGMVIVDECHHVSAVSFERVMKEVNAKYVYGLTATPIRQDGHHPIIHMQCGPIRYQVDAKEQAQKATFDHYLLPRFTTYRSVTTDKGIAAVYTDLAENEMRNAYIIKDVLEALSDGRTPIILTERREHVLLLADRLVGKCKNVITLFGTASPKQRKETMDALQAVPEDETLVIVATGKYVGEGFDYPRLDTLFLALPIAWKGKVAQYAGRLHRNHPGKQEVQIYDYVDIHVPMLDKMYQKRLKGYAAIGYRIKTDGTLQTSPDLIYDGKSFYPVFCEDIRNAKSEVLIVSPFMRKSRITQMLRILSEAMLSKAKVVVVTRPAEDFPEKDRETVIENTERLKSYGIEVQHKSGFHQKFTVIDGQTVWYGSVNFLSFGTAEESIMRFTSHDIAGQLMDTVL